MFIKIPETARGRMWFCGIASAIMMLLFLMGAIVWFAFWLSLFFGLLVGLDAWAVSTGREDLDSTDFDSDNGPEQVDKKTVVILWTSFTVCALVMTLAILLEQTNLWYGGQTMWLYHIADIKWVQIVTWIGVTILAFVMVWLVAKLLLIYQNQDK